MVLKICSQKSAILFAIAILVACCNLLEGCASASVKSMYQKEKKFYTPTVIYVQPYAFSQKSIKAGSSDKSVKDLKDQLSSELTKDLQKDLQKIFPDCRVLTGPAPRGPYWLVTGKFNQIQPGSRLLRSVIGFGAGKTRLSITTHVYTLMNEKPEIIYTVETVGSSGGTPGVVPSAAADVALFPIVPVILVGSSAFGGAYRSSTAGLSFDTKRTAYEITAAISDYLYQHGLLSKKKELSVKRTGPWYSEKKASNH